MQLVSRFRNAAQRTVHGCITLVCSTVIKFEKHTVNELRNELGLDERTVLGIQNRGLDE